MLGRLVARSRLTDLLQQNTRRPLTLVSAPAGYGKTTMVMQWLHAAQLKPAWLQLDEGDNDLRTFLSYFVSAIQLRIPNACPDTMSLLQASQIPDAIVLADALNNELDAIEESFILVLDDYHVITDTTIHELMDNLLQRPPRPLHLVLVTRHDPALSLAAPRACGWMTEIRQSHLRFTRQEVGEVINVMADITLSDAALAHIESEIEGWIVGVHLVGLLLRDQRDPEGFALGLNGDSQHIQEYLLEEVLSTQPERIRNHLMQISILRRFCAPLMEALLPDEPDSSGDGVGEAARTGRDFLDAIIHSNLFVIPLDVHGRWYRFHHLFQYLLQVQLDQSHSRKEIASLHRRASEWLESKGLVDEALDHSLVSGDLENSASVVERQARSALNEDQWFILEKWLARLPETQINQRPELLLANAWIHYYRLNVLAIPPILDQIEEIMKDSIEARRLPAEIAFFRGFIDCLQGQSGNALQHLEYALEHIPMTDNVFRAETELIFALSGQMAGQRERITQTLLNSLADPAAIHPLRETRLLIALTFVSLIACESTGVTSFLNRTRSIARPPNMQNPLAWCDYLEGIFHLRRGELDQAIELLQQATKRKYFQDTRAAVDALAALVIAHELRGQPKDADTTRQALDEFVDYLGPLYLPLAAACATRLAVLREKSDVIDRQLASPPPPPEVMLFWIEIPYVTRCRAWIAEGSEASLQAAQNQLQDDAAANHAQHNVCHFIEILVLQSVIYQKQGEPSQSLKCLTQALELARPGGVILPFVEVGKPLIPLLQQLRANDVQPQFVDQMLEALPTVLARTEPSAAPLNNMAVVARSPARSLTHELPAEITVPNARLTNRELETLELLSQRLYDKEIATAMSISVWTVKSHVKHIYGKLRVKNRRQAVSRAEELGLLTGK